MESDSDDTQQELDRFLASVNQPGKSDKYKVLLDFENWLLRPGAPASNQPYLSSDQIETLLLGDEGLGLLGLCRITVGAFSFKKSKRSCEIALRTVHSMLFDQTYKLRQAAVTEFIGFEAKQFLAMDLGRHF
jgi:hypothetical protein